MACSLVGAPTERAFRGALGVSAPTHAAAETPSTEQADSTEPAISTSNPPCSEGGVDGVSGERVHHRHPTVANIMDERRTVPCLKANLSAWMVVVRGGSAWGSTRKGCYELKVFPAFSELLGYYRDARADSGRHPYWAAEERRRSKVRQGGPKEITVSPS